MAYGGINQWTPPRKVREREEPVSKHQIQPECGERAGLARDGTGLTRLATPNSRRERRQGEKNVFYVQLTTSRILQISTSRCVCVCLCV